MRGFFITIDQMKSVIFYLIDGARPDTLQKYCDQGYLPHISEMISQGSFRVGATCFPSTTGPAYLPYLTGVNPCKHDITGIRWFNKERFKESRWSRDSMRSYCGYEAKYFNDDMNEDYPSILEEYNAYNIYNMITKGVRAERDLTASRKTKLYFRAHFKHEHHPVDEYGLTCFLINVG